MSPLKKYGTVWKVLPQRIKTEEWKSSLFWFKNYEKG